LISDRLPHGLRLNHRLTRIPPYNRDVYQGYL